MKYKIYIIPSAEKELDLLPRKVFNRIIDRILQLSENPHPKNSKKLTDRQEYRLRVGNYRILYSIDSKKHIVVIVSVLHRKDAYK
ncbi:type II toxin-antitoxin system RelE/ParE family toxin [bacterium]|nr:MAG: type II toxin-antitoxin system RelE/ParE family toxin [bacterium]